MYQSTDHEEDRENIVRREYREFSAEPNASLMALAFKVLHDARRGAVVFVRVYSGTLRARAVLQSVAAVRRTITTTVHLLPPDTHGGITFERSNAASELH